MTRDVILSEITLLQVSEDEVLDRINKKLAETHEVIRRTKKRRAVLSIGKYYSVDMRTNCITRTRIDLAGIAKEEGVLRDGEHTEFLFSG